MISGLSAHQLERGKCYRSSSGVIGAAYGFIKIESVGPKFVCYRGWCESEFDAMRRARWSFVRRHPRVLFNSWNGTWSEVDDPSV